MALSYDLISQFAKLATRDKKTTTESTVYGTIKVDENGNKYVKLDGSDQLTPLAEDEQPSVDSSSANANDGERVSVLIKNHTATVTGNISSPAARTGDVEKIEGDVKEIQKFDILVGERLQVQEAYIEKLQTDKAEVGDLTAATAKITELEANKASIEELNAAKADITDLKATKLDAEVADVKYATIEKLDATNADVKSLHASKLSVEDAALEYATIKNLASANASIEALQVSKLSAEDAAITYATIVNLNATNADIASLNVNKLSVEDAKLVYANIDFSNIGTAAIEELFSDSGIIEDLVVSEGKITGELVGVTIKGDLIEGNTIVADKLVVKGDDGLYYKLNMDGESIEAEQTNQNSLNGSVITAKSITATKISVDDLVAFEATIGGFIITDKAIHSDVKDSVDNAAPGVYFDKDGQFSVGDGDNHIKYYKDINGEYKLAIDAESIIAQIEEATLALKNTASNIDKHFSFTSDGLIISAGENQMAIRIDNNLVMFEKDGVLFGWWDGVEFHTGNIMVEVNDRAQFGNFAFIPRSDGSLSFLKVAHNTGFYIRLAGYTLIIYGAYPTLEDTTLLITDISGELEDTTLILGGE